MVDAVVVGSGPNGLAAAVVLAGAGLEVTVLEAHERIGGGTRSEELLVPGVLHDLCSAVHPFGAASPFLAGLDLERHGLRWRHPDIALAHPLDDGRAGVLLRSLDATVEGLGADGAAWRRAFGPMVDRYADVVGEVFRPLLHAPRHPVTLGRFGARAVQPATVFARRFTTAAARGLYAGIAAHSLQPLTRPTTSAAGVMFVGAAHTTGWPVAEGGSQAVTGALAALLVERGGRIETGVRVTSRRQLPPHRTLLLDVTPRAAIEILGDELPSRVRRAYRRYRHGPGSFKLDMVVEGAVPWAAEPCGRAGTVHCGGTLEEVAHAEREVCRGRMPERPFVLVGQQYLADPGRSRGELHPLWAYAHVPHGFDGDATEAILGQIERFAPGLRERIVASGSRAPADLERENPNYVGGDIAAGANTPWQAVARPRLALDPYSTGVPGVFLCSAATPPGAGVHGMCGANAARSTLASLGGQPPLPGRMR